MKEAISLAGLDSEIAFMSQLLPFFPSQSLVGYRETGDRYFSLRYLPDSPITEVWVTFDSFFHSAVSKREQEENESSRGHASFSGRVPNCKLAALSSVRR